MAKIPADVVEKIVQMYFVDGIGSTTISRKLNLCYKTVLRKIKKEGNIRNRRRVINNDILEKIINLYFVDIKSIPQISVELSIPKSAIRSSLLLSGKKLRDRSTAILLSAPRSTDTKRKNNKKWSWSEESKKRASVSAKKRFENTALGVSFKKSGYVQITKGPNIHRPLHVVLIEKKIKRHIRSNECIHHIDGCKSNNSISNLKILTKSEHSRLHRLQEMSFGQKRKREENGRFA
jgi:hypothetical protein